MRYDLGFNVYSGRLKYKYSLPKSIQPVVIAIRFIVYHAANKTAVDNESSASTARTARRE